MGTIVRSAGIGSVRDGLRLAWNADRKRFLITASLAILAALLPAATLLLVRDLVNAIFDSPGTGSVLLACLIAVVIALTLSIQTMTLPVREALTVRVALEAEQRLVRAVAATPFQRFDEPAWHDRLARAKGDLDWRPTQVTDSSLQVLGGCAGLIGILGVIVSTQPVLAVLAVLAVVPVVITRRLITSRLLTVWRETTSQTRRQEYLRTMLTSRESAAEVRAYGLARHFTAEHRELGEHVAQRTTTLVRRTAGQGILVTLPIAIGCLGVAFVLLVRAAEAGTVTPGDVAVLAAAVIAFATELSGLGDGILELIEHGLFLDDYFTLLASAPNPADEDGTARPPVKTAVAPTTPPLIEIDDVWFRYPETDRYVLRGVTLRVEPGTVLALVGDNGAGKSSLVKLLLGFYTPTRGSIRFGGVDLNDIDHTTLLQSVGVVFQSYPRYPFDLRTNIALGRPDDSIDDERVITALRSGGAMDISDRLPLGLDTMLSKEFNDGTDLSGGEWQRIALARLMYRDPCMWILDEPTAALDPLAELAIFERWRETLNGRTGILISHRFSTTRTADHVALIANGQVLEHGSHDDLLTKKSRYAELFNAQAEGYR
ncbi:ABC transporter ATP-binding protein [Pseudonocardia sp. ICBG162]|uniref:ABC transporter ATP-binding protein n=1 Tax=Pseudonocardia sp. ICBG162 TaxID=2846761 RepID=UPI001CF62725|nr:ABC transporter ATP-binding protein [Pseudonocardia sp. ICBG162]